MRRIVAAFVLCIAAFAARAEEQKQIAFGAYIGGLERIDAALTVKRLDVAREEARALRGSEVVAPLGAFRTDDPLLSAVISAKSADAALRARVAVVLDELRHAAPEAAPKPDRAVLQQLDDARRANDLAAGGEIAGTEIPENVPIITRLVRRVRDLIVWIGERLAAVLDWLLDFLPASVRPETRGGSIRGIIIFIAALIVLLLLALALQVLRRGRGATAIEISELPLESRDADPLSRGSNEWERYAAQLAAAERWREAIRAWYHAVLVTLYSSGILHFRKGRTNWEYVASLAPSHPWRGDFVELTRRFEQEWYGAADSSAEAYESCSDRAQQILDELRRVARGAA